uniref:hypothetical protein n=1 Tax=Shewanella donghaensis TaxID=238836 RepID=UPI0013152DE6
MHNNPELINHNQASMDIIGNWINQHAGYIELLQINQDQTYLQLGIDLQIPENSFAEWGSYTLKQTNTLADLPLLISFNPTFSNNPAKGFITLLAKLNNSDVYLNGSDHSLQLNIDTSSDYSIDKIIEYTQLPSQQIEGYWYNDDRDDLYAVLMLENGLYVQLQINFDSDENLTGMEWGQYQHQTDSGEVFFQAEYDDNEQTGFSRFSEISHAALKIKLNDDQLIFLLDNDDNGIIDEFSKLMRKN